MNTLVYMTTRIIEAYECICDKCGYKWSSISLPATCANKTCRTPRWNRELKAPIKVIEMQDVYVPTATVMPLAEKNRAEASPIVEKKTELDGLRALMDAVKIKPKTEPHPALPVYPVEDQPAYDDSKYLQYD